MRSRIIEGSAGREGFVGQKLYHARHPPPTRPRRGDVKHALTPRQAAEVVLGPNQAAGLPAAYARPFKAAGAHAAAYARPSARGPGHFVVGQGGELYGRAVGANRRYDHGVVARFEAVQRHVDVVVGMLGAERREVHRARGAGGAAAIWYVRVLVPYAGGRVCAPTLAERGRDDAAGEAKRRAETGRPPAGKAEQQGASAREFDRVG
jgi:hypothetical protein